MHCTRPVASGIHWVGADDRRLERFENLFPLPGGISYNSYFIDDERTAVLDTVDASVTRRFLENVGHVLSGRTLDYLIINHMEPDHCAGIEELCRRFPDMKIVGNAKTFGLLRNFYEENLERRLHEVKDGDTLSIGRHTLRFVFAPMVHWPEVMVTCLPEQGIAFTADAFGAFGALGGNLFDDEIDIERSVLGEARRYYVNIVGKYGAQVQALLRKLSGVTVRMICPLHGPVWRGSPQLILEKYDRWSRYAPEKPGVAVLYGSMYGNTENAANLLAYRLGELGVRDIRMHDVSKTHPSYVMADAFELSHLVLAAPTYNAGLYPAMEHLLREMAAHNLQGRRVALVGNGSWAPASHTVMRELAEKMKNTEFVAEPLLLRSALKPAQREELHALARAVADSVLAAE